MRKMKVYQLHPCTICAEPTTNKSYCDKHMKQVMRPDFAKPADKFNIYAEAVKCKKHVRSNESVDIMRRIEIPGTRERL